jgi:putative ABC transport system substrate-binding protein
MKRRQFITVLAGAAAWPLMVHAQQVAHPVAHIAFFVSQSQDSLDPRQLEQFKAGLAENGLIEGQNISVDYLWADGSPERMRELAGELARRDLDVIVTAGPQPLRAVIAPERKLRSCSPS